MSSARRLLIDTGPLVALLNVRDAHHDWVRRVLDTVEPPLWTCESVISEACFLVRKLNGGAAAVLEITSRKIVRVAFRLEPELQAIGSLMSKYSNVPMSLADACLVRMTELHSQSTILTMDSDFQIYRRNGRRQVPVLMPQ